MSLANKKIVPLTLIYLINNGKVLLLKRHNNKSIFSGQILGLNGKLEPKEDLIASAQREFF
jgi:8-oxo-dGTP pyrophosphatase MutT (NUDIX family)